MMSLNFIKLIALQKSLTTQKLKKLERIFKVSNFCSELGQGLPEFHQIRSIDRLFQCPLVEDIET